MGSIRSNASRDSLREGEGRSRISGGIDEASRSPFLPGSFTAKAVTRDTCLMSGVTAGETARVGGVTGITTPGQVGRKRPLHACKSNRKITQVRILPDPFLKIVTLLFSVMLWLDLL